MAPPKKKPSLVEMAEQHASSLAPIVPPTPEPEQAARADKVAEPIRNAVAEANAATVKVAPPVVVAAAPPVASPVRHPIIARGQGDDATVREQRKASGWKQTSFWLSGKAHHQLKLMALETGRSTQDIMSDALSDFFVKSGRPGLADLS